MHFLALLPAASAPQPEWLVMRGHITAAQRQELERRLVPQRATSYCACFILDTMGQWSAARATAELLRLGVRNVPSEASRALRFSVDATMAAGLLPRHEYMAFRRVRRVVYPFSKDFMLAQPGDSFDYCIGQN